MCCDLPEVTQLAGAELGLHPGLSDIEPHYLPPFPSVQDTLFFKNSLPSVYSNLSPGPSSGAVHARPRQEKSQFCYCVCALCQTSYLLVLIPLAAAVQPEQAVPERIKEATAHKCTVLPTHIHSPRELGRLTHYFSRWAAGFCSSLCQQSSCDLGFLPSLF